MMNDDLVLLADVGGTNTRVALARGVTIVDGSVTRLRNANFASLADALRHYLREGGHGTVSGACVAVAGPVRNGVGRLTNLNWELTEQELAEATGAKTAAILNDLQAQGYALPHLSDDALRCVYPGRPSGHNEPRLVVGVGTGFNVAPVTPHAGFYTIAPAEAGHVTLPVSSPEDLKFAEFIAGDDGFAAVEDVLSGRGLAHTHAYEAGGTSDLDGAAIMAGLADGSVPTAQAAVARFIRYLGIVAGDLALSFLPFGGLYLCGGVARAISPHLDAFGFSDEFCSKGRFSDFMRQFPVWVIEDDFAALTGCAAYLAQQPSV